MRTRELFSDFPQLQRGGKDTIPAGAADADGAAAEQLTEEERAHVVGLEWRSMVVQDSNLVLRVVMSRPVGEAVEMQVTAFGYRTDVPFEKMPKLHVTLSALGVKVLDQGRPLPRDTVTVERNPKEFTVKIPLAALGNPRRLLASARTHLGLVPLDSVSWRVLEL